MALAAVVSVAVVTGLVLFDPGRKAGTPPAAAPPPGVRGVTAGEIAVGMASPFSGANRELGHDMKVGIETAFAEVNAAGGLHGRKLRLVAVDDGYEPSRTRPAMKQLEGVRCSRSWGTSARRRRRWRSRTPPSRRRSSSARSREARSSARIRRIAVFNFRPSYAEETAAAVRYLVDVRRIRPRASPCSRRRTRSARPAGRARRGSSRTGVRLPHRSRGYRRNTADVDAAVETIARRAADLDAVVMIATYKAAATFIRKVRDRGLGCSPPTSRRWTRTPRGGAVASGPRYADGVVVTQVVPLPGSNAPGVVRFRGALARHAPGEHVGFLSLEGWIVGQLFAEGLRRAGPDPDPEKLVEALEGIRDLDLGIGTLVSFGPPREHQGSHKVWGTVLQHDGSWRQIDLQ
jgi:ABC-type branched-subunit amino acid transport system substrate-binding protein